MPLYFFDSYDGDELIQDDTGLVFGDLENVKAEAALALAEIAKEVLPGAVRRELWIAVRDGNGQPVLKTILVFEVVVLAEGS